MNTKKVTTFSIFAILLFSSLFFMSLASAGVGTDIADGLRTGGEEITPILQILLGGDSLSGEMVFIKLLMFFLLFAILIRVTREVPVLENKAVSIIVSATITLLTVRFLGTEALIEFMWLPQGVLGVLLVTMIPFLIFFYLMKSFEGEDIIVKVGWSAFGVIYAALAFTRWTELANGSEWWNNFAWVYLIIAILSGIMVLTGKAIERHRAKQERLTGRADNLRTRLEEREGKLRDAQNAYAADDSTVNKNWVKREKKRVDHTAKLVRRAERGE